ncbi:unnamed protein product [Rotaria sp. Silwood2]|nr:unnamed protein product [Rotaria sp. Silwood2]
MLIISVMIFLALYNAVHVQHLLYHSDIRPSSYLTFDCLYTQLIQGELNEYTTYITNNHLTPYCRRPDNDEKEEESSDILDDNIANKLTFNELSKQGITGEQLLHWLAPIDLVERYEINNRSSELFYNCSSPWFGSKCQYQFVYDSSLSFNEIIQASLESRSDVMLNVSVTTCYRFLSDCQRGPWSLCLDWRQICNGKVDCMNGEDEQWCEILEMTTCADDEYRCHYGGQCIPLEFVRDNTLSFDCLDSSEEIEEDPTFMSLRNSFCRRIISFQCEESINRYPHAFPCGNGQFLEATELPDNAHQCSNERHRQVTLAMLTSLDHIKDIKCQQAFRCLLLSNRSYGRHEQLYINLTTEKTQVFYLFFKE